MLVCAFSSLPNGEYLKIFISEAFATNLYYDKTSSPAKNSYLPVFPDDKAEILAVCLSKFCWVLFWFLLLSTMLIFSFFLKFNSLSDGKVVFCFFIKSKYHYLV